MTLAQGPFEAREIHKQCRDNECSSVKSNALNRLVKPGQRYGYDLIVQVGLWRYLDGQQREEIRELLEENHGIHLSAGSVTALCDRFLQYLGALHVARAPIIREALKGGYPMHIDATCERGKGGLFVCIDGWHNWVLWSARIPTENSDNITPVVEKAVALFGHPIATVRDMGEGCARSVDSLRKAGIPDLVCHYHFLAAVGKKLLSHRYDSLRGIIRLTRCRSDMRVLLRDLRKYSSSTNTEGRFGEGSVRDGLKALVLWVLEGDGHSDALFPFSLPHLQFAKRCLEMEQQARTWVCRPRSLPERRALACLGRLVARLKRDPRFTRTVDELDTRFTALSELRDVLRISNAELPRGDVRSIQEHLPALELLRLQKIKQAVDQYTTDLEGRIPSTEQGDKKPKTAAGIILRYLRRYGPKLFGHPAKLDEEGRIVAVVERTNNIAEHFFGRQKQQLRRRVGRGQLGRDLADQPAQVAIVSNLHDPRYVRLLSGSLENLPAAFAEIDIESSTEIPPLVRDHRDSQIQSVLSRLLEETVTTTCENERRPTPQLSAPTTVEIITVTQDLEEVVDPVQDPQKTPTKRKWKQIRQISVIAKAKPPKRPLKPRDCRLPPPGSTLERWNGKRVYRIQVLDNGFVFGKNTYSTPTEVAKAINRKTRSGFEFFGLTSPWEQRAAKLRGRRLNRFTMIDLPPTTES